MKKIISTVLCLFIVLSCILPAMAATGVPEEVMESTKSVVRILSKYYNGAATGSGFVIKNEPGEVLIATNDHVVEGNPTSISIWVGEDRMVDAQIVFTTSEKDLCVLKVTDDVDMKPLKLSKEEPQHGAAIYVVGYPGAGDILSDTQAHTSESVTITDGIISAIRSFTIEKGGNPVKLLQVNAAINSGNSGGPLFNTEGVVVGVNTYKVNADSQGVFGSVDISELWSLLDQYGIEIPEKPEVVEAEEEDVPEETSFLMPVLICAGVVCLVLTVILIAKRRKKNTPQRKRKNSKIQMVTLQAHMEKHPQGLGIGGAVSLLLSAAIQLRNLHNEGKLHLQICPENILISADGVTLKEPSSQETGRFNSGFAAPEIYKGAGFGITSDIYSFAAVLLYAATGKVPANSLQQEALDQDFDTLEDSVFAEIICKAMAFSILDRTQSMQELIYSIAVYNAPVQKKQPQPLRTVETVPASVREERPAPVKEEQVKIPKHRKKTVPKKKHRKLMPIAAVLVCGIVAVVLMWKPAEKQEETAELQSTEQAETTVPMTPEEAAYAKAENLLTNGETAKAAIAFGKLGDYSDARERSIALWREITPHQTISVGSGGAAVLKQNGSVSHITAKKQRQYNASNWRDVISVSVGFSTTVGLKADGTLVSLGTHDVNSWSDMVAVDASQTNVMGLKADGTVQVTGHQVEGLCDDWSDIVAISASSHLVGLKMDGTVVAAGSNRNGQCDVQKWTDIIAINSDSFNGTGITIGLKSDGTVLVAGNFDAEAYDLSGWRNIVAVDAAVDDDSYFVAGLTADGKVLSAGSNAVNLIGLRKDMPYVAISAGRNGMLALNSAGDLHYSNDNLLIRQPSQFRDIRIPERVQPYSNKKAEAPPETSVSPQLSEEEAYAAAETLLANGETAKAAIAFGKLGNYSDARERSFALWRKVSPPHTFSAVANDVAHSTVAVKEDGSVLLDGYTDYRQRQCLQWSDIISICTTCKPSAGHTVGLKADGTVVAVGANQHNQCNTTQWRDIVAIGADSLSTYGLKADGTVLFTGIVEDNSSVVQSLLSWKDIVAISSNGWNTHIAGLKNDGTVVSTHFNVNGWTDIISVQGSTGHIVGLKSDGSVVATGNNSQGQCNVSGWSGIIAIGVGGSCTIGLKADGTVVYTGSTKANEHIPFDVSDWSGIAAICASTRFPIGLRADGTLVVSDQTNIANWTDIKIPN